jgi:hypothetical protein
MKARTIGGIITAVIFGRLLAGAMRIDQQKRGQMGREEFLAKQASRFDRHFAKPHPIGAEVFLSVLVSGALFGAYELLAFGISKALGSTASDGKGS